MLMTLEYCFHVFSVREAHYNDECDKCTTLTERKIILTQHGRCFKNWTYVTTYFKAENVLSEVADVMGMVRYSRNMLCITGNIVLYTVCVFMASQIVWTLVTFLTEGVPCLITSGKTGSCFCSLEKKSSL